MNKLTPDDAKTGTRRTILINPPPEDGRCECCGRPMSELAPFEGGDFAGALLIKNFRSMAPANALASMVTPDVLADDGSVDDAKFVAKYGKDKVDQFYFAEQLACSVSPSWECRDCASLTDEEYFGKKVGGHPRTRQNGGAQA